jgi:UDP-glucose-4-epimerase GalE
MRDHQVMTMVFSSTCAVYGVPERVPITEQTAPAPINPYGASKMMVERIFSDYNHAFGLRYVALRYFNAAGADPDGRIGEVHDPETHLIPLMLDVALGRRRELLVFGDTYPTKDGTCVRDYIHVTDLARAHMQALALLEKGGETRCSMNLGTGRGYSVREVIAAAEAVTGRKIACKITAPREGDPPVLVADPALALKTLGWEAEYKDIDRIIAHAWNFHQKPLMQGKQADEKRNSAF